MPEDVSGFSHNRKINHGLCFSRGYLNPSQFHLRKEAAQTAAARRSNNQAGNPGANHIARQSPCFTSEYAKQDATKACSINPGNGARTTLKVTIVRQTSGAHAPKPTKMFSVSERV